MLGVWWQSEGTLNIPVFADGNPPPTCRAGVPHPDEPHSLLNFEYEKKKAAN